jgi:hypothetical protein
MSGCRAVVLVERSLQVLQVIPIVADPKPSPAIELGDRPKLAHGLGTFIFEGSCRCLLTGHLATALVDTSQDPIDVRLCTEITWNSAEQNRSVDLGIRKRCKMCTSTIGTCTEVAKPVATSSATIRYNKNVFAPSLHM